MNRKTFGWCLAGTILAQLVAIGGGIWPLVMVAGGLGALLSIVYLIVATTKQTDEVQATVDFDNSDSLDHWRAKTEVLISWADGTPQEWDRHIRPILGREFRLAVGPKGSSGEFVFGDLWSWVDPKAHGTGLKSPGRHGLDAILKRLELITTGEATE